LQNRFWALSTFGPIVEDQFCDHGTMREEYAEDAPFVGRKRDRPAPSFQVGRDVFFGYFLVMPLTDGDLCLFWVARAVTRYKP
jgi:hypothetical protein